MTYEDDFDWLGDCVEGFNSQGGANALRTVLPLTEQVRIVRRLMLHQIETIAPLAAWRTRNWTVRTRWGRFGYFATDPQNGLGERMPRVRTLLLGRWKLNAERTRRGW